MTGLENFTRLEGIGHLQETAEAPAREVVLRLGRASLLITEFDETPIMQWSLAALIWTREGEGLRLTPAPDADEVIYTDDRDMIEVLTRPTFDYDMPAPTKRGWGRYVFLALVSALVAGIYAADPKAVVAKLLMGARDWQAVAQSQVEELSASGAVCQLEGDAAEVVDRFTSTFRLEQTPAIARFYGLSQSDPMQALQDPLGLLADGRVVISVEYLTRTVNPAVAAELVRRAESFDAATVLFEGTTWDVLLNVLVNQKAPAPLVPVAPYYFDGAATAHEGPISDQDWARLQAFCTLQLTR